MDCISVEQRALIVRSEAPPDVKIRAGRPNHGSIVQASID